MPGTVPRAGHQSTHLTFTTLGEGLPSPFKDEDTGAQRVEATPSRSWESDPACSDLKPMLLMPTWDWLSPGVCGRSWSDLDRQGMGRPGPAGRTRQHERPRLGVADAAEQMQTRIRRWGLGQTERSSRCCWPGLLEVGTEARGLWLSGGSPGGPRRSPRHGSGSGASCVETDRRSTHTSGHSSLF